MKEHKPLCKINQHCAVDHHGAPCPGPYGQCDCGAMSVPNHSDQEGKKPREQGIFYPEGTYPECCDECGDVYFKKTWPEHTAYHACTNLKCPCHRWLPEHKIRIKFFIRSLLHKHVVASEQAVFFRDKRFQEGKRAALEEVLVKLQDMRLYTSEHERPDIVNHTLDALIDLFKQQLGEGDNAKNI